MQQQPQQRTPQRRRYLTYGEWRGLAEHIRRQYAARQRRLHAVEWLAEINRALAFTLAAVIVAVAVFTLWGH